ncbi:MAG: FISUMP domain-containing protein [Sphingobacteriales bacterium]
MKRICVFIGLITLLSACSRKSNVQPENPNIVKINGTAYPTVVIGNQVWTTVNYSGPPGYHSAGHAQYGDYYTQSQALAIILPAGWRVPTMMDYNNLFAYFGPNKNTDGYSELDGSEVGNLLSTSAGWPTTSTDKSGFKAEPNGFFQVAGPTPTYQNNGHEGYFMTSDWGGLDNRFGVRITILGAGLEAASREDFSTIAYSLRFVKDK